ncbi:MAG: hypothetical protein WD771_03655 [Gemmatimonadaceae bacterium]
MHDTSPEAAAVQIAAFRRLEPAERVALALAASDWMMAVARARADSSVPPLGAAPAADALPTAGEPPSR